MLASACARSSGSGMAEASARKLSSRRDAAGTISPRKRARRSQPRGPKASSRRSRAGVRTSFAERAGQVRAEGRSQMPPVKQQAAAHACDVMRADRISSLRARIFSIEGGGAPHASTAARSRCSPATTVIAERRSRSAPRACRSFKQTHRRDVGGGETHDHIARAYIGDRVGDETVLGRERIETCSAHQNGLGESGRAQGQRTLPEIRHAGIEDALIGP